MKRKIYVLLPFLVFIFLSNKIVLFSQTEEKPLLKKETSVKKEVKTSVTTITTKEDMGKNDITTAEKKSEAKVPIWKKALSSTKNFFKNGEPLVGLEYGPLIPVGESGTVLGTGFIALRLNGDVQAFKKNSLTVRSGFSTGFYSIKSNISEISATVNIIPFLFYVKTSYLLEIKPISKFGELNPFVMLGLGGGIVSLNETINVNTQGLDVQNSSKSNFEAMLNFSAGTTFFPKAIANLGFQLAFHYLMIFEQRNASFINISLGALYRI